MSATSADDLVDHFGAVLADGDALTVEPSYNVAPTAEVLLVRAIDGHRRLDPFRWGLVPFWADDPKIGSRMINARSETVAEKPAFRRAFAKRRCLVPADGFYEWSAVEGRKAKQPWYLHRRDDEPLAMAGVWERWRPTGQTTGDDSESGEAGGPPEALTTFAIVTCGPNATMAPIHNRMPVMIPNRHWDRWLDPTSELSTVAELMVPAPDSLLQAVPVSTEVNRATNNHPGLVEPVVPAAEAGDDQPSLPGLNHEGDR